MGRHRSAGRLVAVIAVVALLGGCAASATPGLVSVNGHNLYLSCTGTGTPTVIIQPGFGAGASDWAKVATLVAKKTSVCVYDPIGTGRSDVRPASTTPQQLADDLLALLPHAGAGPYVLVGHSIGGPMVLRIASEHPDLVAGMVLVDPVVANECAPGGFYEGTFPCDGERDPLLTAMFGWENARTQPVPNVPLTVLLAENRWTARGDDVFHMPPGITSDAAKAEFAAAYDAVLEGYAALVPGGQVVKVPFSHNIEVFSPSTVADEVLKVVAAAG